MSIVRSCFLVLLTLSASVVLNAQLLLIPETPSSGIVMKQQVWTVMINNLGNAPRKIMLHISVADQATSQVLLEATSTTIIIDKGVKRFVQNDLAPLTYTTVTPGFSSDRQLSQPMPVGNYLVCYRILDAEKTGEVLVKECVRLVAEPLAPPMLVMPEHTAALVDTRPLFTWVPPAPVSMFSSLEYDLLVTQIFKGQSAQEAVQRNQPKVVVRSFTNSSAYPSSYPDLEPGIDYAWQVRARDGQRSGGNSEVWQFSILPDSVRKIIAGATYISMQRETGSSSVIHQGMLKMEYFNRTDDSTARVEIIQMRGGRRAKAIHSFVVNLKPGQNLIERDISRKIIMNSDNSYEAVLVNSRGEKWTMRFTSKSYTNN